METNNNNDDDHAFLKQIILKQINIQENNKILFKKILRRISIGYLVISLAIIIEILVAIILIINI